MGKLFLNSYTSVPTHGWWCSRCQIRCDLFPCHQPPLCPALVSQPLAAATAGLQQGIWGTKPGSRAHMWLVFKQQKETALMKAPKQGTIWDTPTDDQKSLLEGSRTRESLWEKGLAGWREGGCYSGWENLLSKSVEVASSLALCKLWGWLFSLSIIF